MSLENIKTKAQAQRGFTIVELLIVVVVIAILAAITIVSYNGITARANQSAAKASASTVQKKAELFAADSGLNRYPLPTDTAPTAFPGTDASKSWYFSGITANYSTTVPTASPGNSTVRILKCASTSVANQAAVIASNITGLVIYYWDPIAGAEAFTTAGTGTTPTAGPSVCPLT